MLGDEATIFPEGFVGVAVVRGFAASGRAAAGREAGGRDGVDRADGARPAEPDRDAPDRDEPPPRLFAWALAKSGNASAAMTVIGNKTRVIRHIEITPTPTRKARRSLKPVCALHQGHRKRTPLAREMATVLRRAPAAGTRWQMKGRDFVRIETTLVASIRQASLGRARAESDVASSE